MILIGLRVYLITHLAIHFSHRIIRFRNNNKPNSNSNLNNHGLKLFIILLNLAKYLQQQLQISNNNQDNSNNSNNNKCPIFSRILILILILDKMGSLDNLIFNKILGLIKMMTMKDKILRAIIVVIITIIVTTTIIRIFPIQIICLIISIHNNKHKVNRIVAIRHRIKIQANIKISKEIFDIRKGIIKKLWIIIQML